MKSAEGERDRKIEKEKTFQARARWCFGSFRRRRGADLGKKNAKRERRMRKKKQERRMESRRTKEKKERSTKAGVQKSWEEGWEESKV